MSGSMQVDRSTTVVRSTTSEPVHVAHPDALVHDGDVVRLAHRFVSRSMGHRVGSRGPAHGSGPAHLVGHALVHVGQSTDRLVSAARGLRSYGPVHPGHRFMGRRVGSRGPVHDGGPAHLVGHDLVHRVGHDPARVAPTSTPTTTGPRT